MLREGSEVFSLWVFRAEMEDQLSFLFFSGCIIASTTAFVFRVNYGFCTRRSGGRCDRVESKSVVFL
jgi:hypothetical protein